MILITKKDLIQQIIKHIAIRKVENGLTNISNSLWLTIWSKKTSLSQNIIRQLQNNIYDNNN